MSGTTPVSTPREPELIGQTVVVVGGTAGIGLETARLARAEGADVVLAGVIPIASSRRRTNSAPSAQSRSTRPTPVRLPASLIRFRPRSTT
jgi:NAD(P)-dependent dehydrogenase (short-subunit alcohol dehydrogenase family)